MSNLEKYSKVFIESFSISEEELSNGVEYNSITLWDSVGHMGMIAALEEEFDIMLDMDDIIEFSSFEKGKEILKKYSIKL